MGFSFANLTRWLLTAGVAVAVAYAAEAQHAGRRPGQSILFSSADGDDVSSNMPSLTPKPPGLLDFANAVQSPALKSGAESEPLPEPQAPVISPAQAQRMQRLLDERKNWALLTPEQILGLPTQDKILGIPDRDALGQPKNATVMEQYNERQKQARARANNDYYGAADSAPRWGGAGSQDLQLNPGIWPSTGGRPGNLALMNQAFDGTQDNPAAPVQASKSGWSKPFSLPTASPGPTSEQKAALQQFQQLLQPRSLPGDSAKTPALGAPIFSASSTAPSPPSGQQFPAIPVGASFTPLSSGIGLPTGVAPLPGLLGQNNTAPALLTPEWKPQPPPWLSSGPQPGAIPQRKF